jgi:penicillin V acylase-like amidase (Ntn superfamily)
MQMAMPLPLNFLNGKMVVHKGTNLPFPVLTNHDYKYSLQETKAGATEGNNSLERFATTCSMISQFNKSETNTVSPVNYSFNILSEVSQGSFTKWSIVYDIKNKQIHFKTEGHADVKTVSFSDLDFSCKASARSFILNQDIKGNIRAKLVDFTSSINEKSLRNAFKESAGRITVSENEIMELINYANQVACK